MNRNGRVMFWTMVAVGVAVNVLLGCGPVKNCGAWRRRDTDGATCRECVDHGDRYAQCGMRVRDR